MPFWSEADGSGFLFQRSKENRNRIEMSAPMESLRLYLSDLFLSGELANPNSQSWQDQVETNPLYAWFMAGLTLAAEGTSKYR